MLVLGRNLTSDSLVVFSVCFLLHKGGNDRRTSAEEQVVQAVTLTERHSGNFNCITPVTSLSRDSEEIQPSQQVALAFMFLFIQILLLFSDEVT